MKIETKDQFFAVADIWYQRTIRLAEIWQTEEEIDPNRRAKAVRLWSIMAARMAKVTQKAIEISTPKSPANFKPGSIPAKINRRV